MSCQDLTAEEVAATMRIIKVDQSPGPDGVHPLVVKELADVLTQPVTRLFNTSLVGLTPVPTIKVPGVDTSYWLYHSSPKDNSGLYGVAFVLNKAANDAMISWEPVSSRLALASFKGSPHDLTVIAIYVTTNSADDETKDEFYTYLQEVINRVSRHDVLFIAGDWNARTCTANESTRHILGRFGLGQHCENDGRLTVLADINTMVVCSTRFQHPKKHLLPWYSNDGRTTHQLDHILVKAHWASSVEDFREYRGAITGNRKGTDHVLLRACFKVHLSTRAKVSAPSRINVAALGNPEKRKALSRAITTRLTNATNAQADEVSMEGQWTRMKVTIEEASWTVLGRTKRRTKDWISESTLQLSTRAHETRLAGSSERRRLQREATRSAKADRKRY
ncbi:unnamed protein product [Fasciola hepatica]|uniref:Endonuclease/exonuclease/phosphatase domain-containing protein n=1 Tax=Fasciola hepatica TaxID=6192 RepID=A0ABC9HGV1_FASHE